MLHSAHEGAAWARQGPASTPAFRPTPLTYIAHHAQGEQNMMPNTRSGALIDMSGGACAERAKAVVPRHFE
jgi:hypothetical protein